MKPKSLFAGTAALASFAAIAVGLMESSSASRSTLLDPLYTRLDRFDTLYLYLEEGFTDGLLPRDGVAREAGYGYGVYLAADGRMTIDRDQYVLHGMVPLHERWYYDGRTLYEDSPELRNGRRSSRYPSASVLLTGVKFISDQLRFHAAGLDLVQEPLPGFKPSESPSSFRLIPKGFDLPLEIHLDVDPRDGTPKHVMLSGPGLPTSGTFVSVDIKDFAVNVPVPLGTFQRKRPDGSPCLPAEIAAPTDHDCVVPHHDPWVDSCDYGPGCDRPQPVSLPATAYRKGGKCDAHGSATPDGLKGC